MRETLTLQPPTVEVEQERVPVTGNLVEQGVLDLVDQFRIAQDTCQLQEF